MILMLMNGFAKVNWLSQSHSSWNIFIVSCLCVGCTIPAAYQKTTPLIEMPCSWHNKSDIINNRSSSCFDWQHSLNDPVLDSLIQSAWHNNLDLNLARASITAENTAVSYENFYAQWTALSAEVAVNYIQLRSKQQLIILTEKSISRQQESLRLVQELLSIGIVSALDFQDAKNQLTTLKAKVPLIQVEIDKTIHHLSYLLGYAPGELYNLLSPSSKLPTLPQHTPTGTPAELLCHRADIRIAQIKLSCAQNYCLALLEYQKTVMQALEEVENALSAISHEEQRSQHLTQAMDDNFKTYELSLQLFKKGIRNYQEVLQAQLSLTAAEEASLQSQENALLYYISLYKALGIS